MDPYIEDVRPRLSAVVVTHNGEAWLGACLRSLREQIYGNVSVIVVDSGSDVDAGQIVAEELPSAQFVRLDRNVGFGAAANHALEVGIAAPDSDHFLFMHDDVVLDPEAVSLLVAAAVETGAGIVGGKGVGWDHPQVLIEVGMLADQFGYPFSGLEEGEIDQGQHDSQRETLYVTNACMLVSRSLIERCGSWDGGYFAFGEDLDLCTRARLSGFKVMVQPGARFRHVVASSNQLRDGPASSSIRFLTRRNRMRTLAKNSAAYRLPFLVMIYTFLAVAEMIILAFFRRFEQIPAYPRAFFSFMRSVPDVFRRRRAVQKRRSVPDRRIRRYMARDSHRARVFLERRLRDWEAGTLTLGARTLSHLAPSRLGATFIAWFRRPSTIAMSVLVLVLTFALRRYLFAVTPVAAGSLWPFPDQTSRLLSDFLSGWRNVGLGTGSASPAMLPIIWLSSFLALGKPILAQKILMAVLVGIGIWGISRFSSRRTTSWAARVFGVVVYSLGPVTRSMFESGDLAAMAVFAGLPFILEIAMRMLGPVPGEEGDRAATGATTEALSRDAIRLSLVCAPVVALAPSSFVLIAVSMILLSAHSSLGAWDRRETIRRVKWVLAALPGSLFLLVPWSLESFRPRGAILGPLFSRGSFDPAWDLKPETFIWLNPDSTLIAAGITSVVVFGAIWLSSPSRRREGRELVTLWLGVGVIGAAVALGYIPTVAASPYIWLVGGLAASAALATHLVAGMREELPKHALGWRHVVSPLNLTIGVACMALTWAPHLTGWERPTDTFAAGTSELSGSIASYLTSTAEQVGDFRVLWLGDKWVDPIRSGSRRMDGAPFFITGPDGVSMLDAQEGPPSKGEKRLSEIVDDLVGRRLHLAGHLLGPASVRFIIVDPSDTELMLALTRQRDIALEQQLGGIAVFRNLQWLPRASLAPVNLVESVTRRGSNDRALMLVEWSGGRAIPQRSETSFRGQLPRTRHSQILLGENYDGGWRARVDGTRLKHSEAFGWANRFELPPDADGEVRVTFNRDWRRFLWLTLEGFLIALALAASRPGRHEIRGWLR